MPSAVSAGGAGGSTIRYDRTLFISGGKSEVQPCMQWRCGSLGIKFQKEIDCSTKPNTGCNEKQEAGARVKMCLI